MIFIFVLICILLVLKTTYTRKGFNREYISPETMLPWKGFFILLIFMRHMVGGWHGNINLFDQIYININDLIIGQLVVVLFLFLSGYGVICSIDKKGQNYLNEFPKKRIFKTWIHFAIIVLLYGGLQFLLGNSYNLKTVIKALIAIDSLGNSNWYIFAILYLYIASFIGFFLGKLLNKKLYLALGTSFVLLSVLIYMIIFRKVLQYSTVWYDSIVCYVMGMVFYLIEDRVLKIVQFKTYRYWCVLVMVCLVFAGNRLFLFSQYNYLIYFWIQSMAIIAFVLLFSMKFTCKSKLLSWCGKNLFYIYILQRIPFIILDYIGLSNLYLYFIIATIGTIFLVYAMQKIFRKMDSILF